MVLCNLGTYRRYTLHSIIIKNTYNPEMFERGFCGFFVIFPNKKFNIDVFCKKSFLEIYSLWFIKIEK